MATTRHAYEAWSTFVMCVRERDWREAHEQDTDDEARGLAEIVSLQDLRAGDRVRAFDADENREFWARVSAVALGDRPERVAEYRVRYVEQDPEGQRFQCGGFAAVAEGTAVLVSAPPPRLERETTCEILGMPFWGKVTADYYDIAESRSKEYSLGWNVAALSTSDANMRRRLQEACEARGLPLNITLKRKIFTVSNERGDSVQLNRRGYESSHQSDSLDFSDVRGRAILNREACEAALVEKLVAQRGVRREHLMDVETLVRIEEHGMQIMEAKNARSFHGALDVFSPPLMWGLCTRPRVCRWYWVDVSDDFSNEFVADDSVWWCVGFWLGDGSTGKTSFSVGVGNFDSDDDIAALADATNQGNYGHAKYAETEFTSVLGVFAEWLRKGYCRRVTVSERHTTVDGDVRHCVTVSLSGCDEFKALLEHLDVFNDKTIGPGALESLLDLTESARLAFLAGLVDSDGCRGLWDVDCATITQATAPIEDAVRPNASRGHDTILAAALVLAGSSHVDARLSLRRRLASFPSDARPRLTSSGVVSLTSQTRLLPIVVPSKRTELSRPEHIFSHVGACFGAWKRTNRAAVAAEITLEGASRVVLANGTVIAVTDGARPVPSYS